MTYKLINPNKEIHPHRKKMTDDDWDRLNRVIVGKVMKTPTLTPMTP
jgi:hypothetical protein